MNTLALLYERVSTDEQDTQRQSAILRHYCDQLHLETVATYGDPDTSGSIPFLQREEGAELFAELKRLRQLHGPDQPIAVVTSEQDRIGRDTLDIIQTIRSLWTLGVTPHFAAENGPLVRNPHNEFILTVKAGTSQLERDMIRHRITSKLKAKREKGELCGTIPFGWDAIETGEISPKGVRIRKLVDNVTEQHWLQQMIEWRRQGYSYGYIAKQLNNAGVPTKKGARNEVGSESDPTLTPHPSPLSPPASPPRWQQGNVKNVLTNATVTAWQQLQNNSEAA